MLESNKIVHSLWIGKELSNLELLTIRSFLDNGHELWLWAYDEIITPLPPNLILKDANEIIPKEYVFSYKQKNQYGHGKGSYAGFSDIFRYALLYKYGGWWTDMDVTCLTTLNYEQSYVFRKHHIFATVGNLMKCPPKSLLMKECYEEAITTIDQFNHNWDKPIIILNKYIVKHNLQQFIFDFTNPDKWSIVKTYLYSKPTLAPNIKAIHWVNEEWRRHGINKQMALNASLYKHLLTKHNIISENINTLNYIILRFRLSYLYSLIQLIKHPKSLIQILKNMLVKN